MHACFFHSFSYVSKLSKPSTASFPKRGVFGVWPQAGKPVSAAWLGQSAQSQTSENPWAKCTIEWGYFRMFPEMGVSKSSTSRYSFPWKKQQPFKSFGDTSMYGNHHLSGSGRSLQVLMAAQAWTAMSSILNADVTYVCILELYVHVYIYIYTHMYIYIYMCMVGLGEVDALMNDELL